MDLELIEVCWKCEGNGEYTGLVAYDQVKTPSGKVVTQKTKYEHHIKCECCDGMGWKPSSDAYVLINFLEKHFDLKFNPKKYDSLTGV